MSLAFFQLSFSQYVPHRSRSNYRERPYASFITYIKWSEIARPSSFKTVTLAWYSERVDSHWIILSNDYGTFKAKNYDRSNHNPSPDNQLYFSPSVPTNEQALRSVVTNNHRFIHLGSPKNHLIALRVSWAFIPKERIEWWIQEGVQPKLGQSIHNCAKIIADYAREPEERCSRCDETF